MVLDMTVGIADVAASFMLCRRHMVVQTRVLYYHETGMANESGRHIQVSQDLRRWCGGEIAGFGKTDIVRIIIVLLRRFPVQVAVQSVAADFGELRIPEHDTALIGGAFIYLGRLNVISEPSVIGSDQ